MTRAQFRFVLNNIEQETRKKWGLYANTKWKKKEEIVMIRAILLIAKKKLSPMTRNELLIE